MPAKEAQSRIKINKLLEKSGWSFLDEENQKANILVEAGVKLDHLGDDFEHSPRGAIDYLLLDSHGFPICVLEAKKESIHPLSAKEQARDYAISKNARFIILSNGNSHYLWDRENGTLRLSQNIRLKRHSNIGRHIILMFLLLLILR